MMTRPVARSGAPGTPTAPPPAPTPRPADPAGFTREELRRIVLDLLG